MAYHPQRRAGDMKVHLWEKEVVGFLFGIFLTLATGIPGVIWAGSRWVTRMEDAIGAVDVNLHNAVSEMREHVRLDDNRTVQITETIQSIDKTLTRVVVNQENLQGRVDRLEKLDDNSRAN